MTDKTYQPTIAGLRAFVAVAEKQHFGSAATTLGVSQSTLSQALSALETGLGVQLVERSTRRVFLTTEGRALLPQAQAVIEAATAFTAAAGGASDPLLCASPTGRRRGVHGRGRRVLGPATGHHPAGPDPDSGALHSAHVAGRAGRSAAGARLA